MEMILKQCESGRWLGWPKDREDIMASGETKDECTANLNEMYAVVMEYEGDDAPFHPCE